MYIIFQKVWMSLHPALSLSLSLNPSIPLPLSKYIHIYVFIIFQCMFIFTYLKSGKTSVINLMKLPIHKKAIDKCS